jgi:formyl-CoA transferase
LEREVSGEGQWVQTSLLQAQAFMLDFQAARWLQMGEVAKQAGNNHPTSIPTGVFKTKDGHINIASTGQVMWERLCNAIGAPELIAHPDYKTGALRSKNRDAVNAAIEAKTVARTSAEWIDAFNEIGVPCGPIYSIDQMFADAQVKHLGIAQAAKRPDGSEQVFVGQPFALSRTPSKIVATPPGQGEHTDEVLKEFGFADDEIAALHKAQAV